MKKQTTITACTFVTMAMEAPAVFVVQPAMSKHVKYAGMALRTAVNEDKLDSLNSIQ